MEMIQDNMQKYENYREQMKRLKKALNDEFYLEAIFIEYAVMEDRLESALCHAGKWKEPKPGKFISLQDKKDQIAKMAEQKNSMAQKYFSGDILCRVIQWKTDRNTLIHELLKQSIHTAELKELAERGQFLVKELSNKVRLHNRALEWQAKKSSES